MKKIAWKPGGSLGPHGQPGVLTLTYLQSLGSNKRLEIAKGAQKSVIHFGMGVLIICDQCDNVGYFSDVKWPQLLFF